MGYKNSTSASIPSTGTEDEYDPNYVAGGDPNQLPSQKKTPAWKQYMSEMMGNQQPDQRSGGSDWSGTGKNVGHMVSLGLAKLGI